MKKNDNLKKLKSASLTAKEIYLLIGGDKEPINNGNAILGCTSEGTVFIIPGCK